MINQFDHDFWEIIDVQTIIVMSITIVTYFLKEYHQKPDYAIASQFGAKYDV